MQSQENRICNACKYAVSYCRIYAGPELIDEMFAALMLDGDEKGFFTTTASCPKCGQQLTLATTSPVSPAHKPGANDRAQIALVPDPEHIANTKPRARPARKQLRLVEIDEAPPRTLPSTGVGMPNPKNVDPVVPDPSLDNLHWRPTNLPEAVTAAIGKGSPPQPQRRSVMSRVITIVLFPLKQLTSTLNDLLNPGHTEPSPDDTRDWGNRFHR